MSATVYLKPGHVRIDDEIGQFTIATREWAEREVKAGTLARTTNPRLYKVMRDRIDIAARQMEARLARKRPAPRYRGAH